MLAIAIVATVIAAFAGWASWRSAVHAKRSVLESHRSADAAEASLAEARRSADAAEQAAQAAAITAEADRAENHRKRTPQLTVLVDALAEHNGNAVIYRVINDGPANLDSVLVYRPVLGDVEGRIIHRVAGVGGAYEDVAQIGPIPMGEYGRFTLSLGSGTTLPTFRVKIASTVDTETWERVFTLPEPRKSAPPTSPVAVLDNFPGADVGNMGF